MPKSDATARETKSEGRPIHGPMLPRPARTPGGASERPHTSPGFRSRFESLDLWLGAALALVGGAAATFLPPKDPARFLLALPTLLLVPGYLLIQVLLPRPASRSGRLRHALVALGVSPALVALLALSTALVEGGFRANSIMVVVTAACLLLAGGAYVRRASPWPSPTRPITDERRLPEAPTSAVRDEPKWPETAAEAEWKPSVAAAPHAGEGHEPRP